MWSYNPGDAYLPGLLAEAGIALKDRDRSADEFQARVAEENFEQLDDHVLVLIDVGEDTSSGDAIEASPVFRAIPAVVEGRYHRISFESARALLWPGPLAMPTVVEVLTDILP